MSIYVRFRTKTSSAVVQARLANIYQWSIDLEQSTHVAAMNNWHCATVYQLWTWKTRTLRYSVWSRSDAGWPQCVMHETKSGSPSYETAMLPKHVGINANTAAAFYNRMLAANGMQKAQKAYRPVPNLWKMRTERWNLVPSWDTVGRAL